MVKRYYVNKNSNNTGEHEVHIEECKYLPDENNRVDLGYQYNSKDALIKAKTFYSDVDGCFWCCREIHTK